MRMKIYYEESTESGYDTMSQMSTTDQLDNSRADLDVSELEGGSTLE